MLPSSSFRGCVRIDQWPEEFQAHQVEALSVLHAQYLGAEVARDLG